ncbi:transcriptional regulator PdhR [Glaciecola sp. 33A]|nr:GntR family transcriptional regulator [Glaciecola sp. 33A]PKI01061.1 transcriptional regulator PdhR [Glaciecola sp. 33A]
MHANIKHQKLSDVITERLESMILDGTLVAGEKLLPERLLAEKFQVSRPSLREAIQNLQAKGLVERKQGGGTFIRQNLSAKMTDPLSALVASRPETQFDLLEFRHALEGMAAYYAALRGQPEDYRALNNALNSLPSLHKSEAQPRNAAAKQTVSAQNQVRTDTQQEAEALVEFYLTMAKASHNMVLLHVMRSMQGMLVDNIKRNLEMLRDGADVEAQIREQRHAIVQAISSQDPEAARKASNKHLGFVESTLLDINKRDVKLQRAMRRIEVKENGKAVS